MGSPSLFTAQHPESGSHKHSSVSFGGRTSGKESIAPGLLNLASGPKLRGRHGRSPGDRLAERCVRGTRARSGRAREGGGSSERGAVRVRLGARMARRERRGKRVSRRRWGGRTRRPKARAYPSVTALEPDVNAPTRVFVMHETVSINRTTLLPWSVTYMMAKGRPTSMLPSSASSASSLLKILDILSPVGYANSMSFSSGVPEMESLKPKTVPR